MTILETERLQFRFVEAADLDGLAAIYADPEVMRFIGGPLDRNGAWDRIQRMQALYGQRHCGPYATILKATGELIGRCGFLFWTIEGHDEVEVAYLLARPHWGRGFATEAARALVRYGFDAMRLSRIISLIHPENIASIRVAEKAGLGFEREVVIPPHGLRRCHAISK